MSIFSSTRFLEDPYQKALLYEAMNAPEKEIKDLTSLAKQHQNPTPNKLILLIQKIWHRMQVYLFGDYATKFELAARKIDLYYSAKEPEKTTPPESEVPSTNSKADMLSAIGERIDPKMEQAWSALLSDCDPYIKSWTCNAKGDFTLEFTKELKILIPADNTTFIFSVIKGNLNQGSKKISFGNGLPIYKQGYIGTLYIFEMSYIKSKSAIKVRGGYGNHWPVVGEEERPIATTIRNWSQHQIA